LDEENKETNKQVPTSNISGKKMVIELVMNRKKVFTLLWIEEKTMIVGKVNNQINAKPTQSLSPETHGSSVNHLTNIGSYSKNVTEK